MLAKKILALAETSALPRCWIGLRARCRNCRKISWRQDSQIHTLSKGACYKFIEKELHKQRLKTGRRTTTSGPELIAWCRGQMANYKVIPRGVEVIDELPMNASGKVMKDVLRIGRRAVGVVFGGRYGFHRQARRRPSKRLRAEPGRWHDSSTLSGIVKRASLERREFGALFLSRDSLTGSADASTSRSGPSY
jgi:hypothetical protein